MVQLYEELDKLEASENAKISVINDNEKDELKNE
jgi:hypothetical protein